MSRRGVKTNHRKYEQDTKNSLETPKTENMQQL